MKLLTQPEAGIEQILKGIAKAKKSIQVTVFRFDRSEIEEALMEAVDRGVFVHALIAHTNRDGEDRLRKLEMRLLDKGVSVTRTAGDLARYHGKMMVVDRKELHLFCFNFTHLDIDHSRSFALITRNAGLVHEAEKLFEADAKRQKYEAGQSRFVVSPVNARDALAAFVKAAKKELLIYDPKISDPAMLRALQERKNAGVEVRVIGKVTRNRLPARVLSGLRLHARAILRDGEHGFLGSQSLRRMELDSRREIGVIFRNPDIVGALARTFDKDWGESESSSTDHDFPVNKTARRMAKVVGKNLPVAPVVEQVVKAIQKKGPVELRPKEIEETVRTAVKEAVKDSVKDATKEIIRTLEVEDVQEDKNADQ